MSNQEIIDAMEANLLFQMSYFPQHFPCMSLKILPDVTLVRSEIPNTNFNYVMNAQFTTDSLKESVLKTMGEFQGTPFAWWIAEKQGSKELVNCLKTEMVGENWTKNSRK